MTLMKRLSIPVVLLLIGAAAQAAGDSRVESLVASERAFAAMSLERGFKPAFLTYLADDGIIFRPGPVNGREYFEGLPDSDATLAWEPIFADISEGGDLGYTTGPWSLTRTHDGKETVTYGQYITVWKKLDDDDDTSWHVAIDHGIVHPQAGVITPVESPAPSPQDPVGVERAATSLESTEAAFDKACRSGGLAAGYKEFLAGGVRLYRDGSPPILGIEKVRETLAASPGRAEHERLGAATSRSGDLGYTWGTLRITASGSDESKFHNFMRIWKKSTEGDWTIVVDVVTPYPSAD